MSQSPENGALIRAAKVEALREAAMSIEYLPNVTGITEEQHDHYVRDLLKRADQIEADPVTPPEVGK